MSARRASTLGATGVAEGRRGPEGRHGRMILVWLVAFAMLWQALAASLGPAAGLAPDLAWIAGAICSSTNGSGHDGSHDQPARPDSNHAAACCILCLSPSLAACDLPNSSIRPVAVGIRRTPTDGSPVTDLAATVHPGQPRAPPFPA